MISVHYYFACRKKSNIESHFNYSDNLMLMSIPGLSASQPWGKLQRAKSQPISNGVITATAWFQLGEYTELGAKAAASHVLGAHFCCV